MKNSNNAATDYKKSAKNQQVDRPTDQHAAQTEAQSSKRD
jgi:hypothetical protein